MDLGPMPEPTAQPAVFNPGGPDAVDEPPSRLVRDIRGTLPAAVSGERYPAVADDGVDADQPLTEPSDLT